VGRWTGSVGARPVLPVLPSALTASALSLSPRSSQLLLVPTPAQRPIGSPRSGCRFMFKAVIPPIHYTSPPLYGFPSPSLPIRTHFSLHVYPIFLLGWPPDSLLFSPTFTLSSAPVLFHSSLTVSSPPPPSVCHNIISSFSSGIYNQIPYDTRSLPGLFAFPPPLPLSRHLLSSYSPPLPGSAQSDPVEGERYRRGRRVCGCRTGALGWFARGSYGEATVVQVHSTWCYPPFMIPMITARPFFLSCLLSAIFCRCNVCLQ